MKTDPRILVAIPVYNEQGYVDRVLTEVRRYVSDVLVIDDGSTDHTPLLLARQPVEVVRHVVNRGYGQSMIDAFRWSMSYRYDWLITMDCDEQHEPAALPEFIDAIARNDADVISGSRYMDQPPAEANVPEDRRAINAQLTGLINERLGLSITDAFCGFKAYRVSIIQRLQLDEEGYAFPLQFWVQAAAGDVRVTEIPVRLIYNDPNRSFGGPLNDALIRRAHYLHVFESEMRKFPEKFGAANPHAACRVY